MITMSEHLKRTVLILDALKDAIKVSEVPTYIPWMHLDSNVEQFKSHLDDSSTILFNIRRSSDSWNDCFVFSNKFIIFQEKLATPFFVRVISNITEEEFFQNSMSVDYGNLKHEDIVNLHKIKEIIQHMLGI